MSRLLQALRERPLLSDGAMGTQLQQAGLEPGGCGEAWNVDAPEKVLAIQRAYVEAGVDCLTTNTFGGSGIMLVRHGQGAPERVAAINRAGVEVARRAFGDRPGLVIGDIGPFGGLMEPYGEVTHDSVVAAFREQARALVEAGADAIIIETQTALEELAIGIAAAREAGAPVVIGSLAFDEMMESDEVRTMMGISPEDAAAFLVEHGADIAAFNCGTGIDMKKGADIARRYAATCSLPIMGQPNAGQPELDGLEVVYRETPEHMAAGVTALIESGVRIVGGCCGSTPAHIRAFREVLDQLA
jgi:5-methyltetrahydrofolate--homocysteine methyltransferase